MRLHNRTAITFLQEFAAQRKASVWEQLAQIGEKCVISRQDWEFLLSQIQSKASICVHFHPYRRGKDGRSVIEGLLSHGKYLNQFETQISNGSLTAFPGGQRDRWEQEMFGGRMGSPELSPGLRPKYGALDLLRHASGPCPRFGSCYLVLSPTLNPFATVCYGDSYIQPQAKAPIAEMVEVLASLFSESFDRAYALGEVGLLPPDLFDTILKRMAIPYVERVNGPTVANLNHYLEAQIHSEVLLEEDVAALVRRCLLPRDRIRGLVSTNSQNLPNRAALASRLPTFLSRNSRQVSRPPTAKCGKGDRQWTRYFCP